MSKDPDQEYFNDGMTDTLITDLSKLSGLFVIARNSAFIYKGKAVKVQEVSKELGVRYVLEGSVQKADNRVRINVQLIDAATNGHLWAERFDRELQDIFALQDEVTQRVVAALQVQLTAKEQEQLVRKNTDNVEAYEPSCRGRAYYFRYTKEENAQARQMFERAIALDPRYTDAYVLLGFTHWLECELRLESESRRNRSSDLQSWHTRLLPWMTFCLGPMLPWAMSICTKISNLMRASPSYSRR